MSEPRRDSRRWDFSSDESHPKESQPKESQPTESQPIPPLEAPHKLPRETLPEIRLDVPPRRPAARPPSKSAMRPRRARGVVAEIDASSHRDDPRREK